MGRVKARSLRLRDAAELLELSYRQAKRIWARYRAGGAKALQHGNCGRVSNRAYTAKYRAAVLKQVKARYEDFGPTLASEHLASDDGMEVHAETLRRCRELPASQCVSGRTLSHRTQSPLRAACGGGSRLSPATAHGAATGRSVLAGGGTSRE